MPQISFRMAALRESVSRIQTGAAGNLSAPDVGSQVVPVCSALGVAYTADSGKPPGLDLAKKYHGLSLTLSMIL